LPQPPPAEIRAELESAIAQDRRVLGAVFPLLQQGLSDSEIARKLEKNTSGFVANNRAIIRAVLDGAMPRGSAIAQQVAGAVRRISATPGLSQDARQHLSAISQELDDLAGGRRNARTMPKSAPLETLTRPAGNLRALVDGEIRQRIRALTERVKAEALVDADDYYRAVSGPFALDQVVDLVARQVPSRTSAALRDMHRYNLTVEQAVVDWSADLPLASDLVETARGRLAYWSRI
jgi:hypothetical protein